MSDIRVFIAGDFCSKPSTSLISVSDELSSLIQACDLKVVNFEVPLKPDVSLPPQQYERFWQNDDVPGFLKNLGFNLFSLASNHAFDWGDAGYMKTKKALGDQAFGAGVYDEAYKLKVCEIGGLKIGFMALTYAAYTGVFDDVLHHEGLGCAYINDLRVYLMTVLSILMFLCRRLSPDIVILSIGEPTAFWDLILIVHRDGRSIKGN